MSRWNHRTKQALLDRDSFDLAATFQFLNIHLVLATPGCGFIPNQVLITDKWHVKFINPHGLTPIIGIIEGDPRNGVHHLKFQRLVPDLYNALRNEKCAGVQIVFRETEFVKSVGDSFRRL